MKVVLLEEVKNVGTAGEVVEVSDGYARNYLFPNGLAAQATEGRVKEAEKKKAKKVELEQVALEEVQRQVDLIDGKTLLMKLEVGPEGKPFGAITTKDLSDEIDKNFGIKLPKGVVKLKEPIKQIGECPVHLEFPHGLEADLILVVEPIEKDKT